MKCLLKLCFYAATMLIAPGASTAESQPSPKSVLNDSNSAGAFVQDFYDWYAPMAFRQKNSLPWEPALASHKELFAFKLLYALKRDSLAMANADGTYTGLDFDPFLNSDNPCQHYLADNVLIYEKSYRVTVKAICNGKLRPNPVVLAEVEFKKDHWLFTNFYYPEGRDLLRVLSELRQQRRDDLK